MNTSMDWQDITALLFFCLCWKGYAFYFDRKGKNNSSLLAVTNQYRLHWMREMLKRDNRSGDVIMAGNLSRSITFFASTTIFILIGLMTMLGYHDQAQNVITTIPFAKTNTGFLWEVKIFLLIVIFIYAFFKYTWSLRQYNYAGIFIMAAPGPKDRVDEHEEIAQRGANLAANAARHFNLGLRAYYFGLAVLSWFVHPYLFMAVTAWVVFVTYRREHRSGTLSMLTVENKEVSKN